MAPPFGYGLWTWFSNSKTAQIVATIGLICIVWIINGKREQAEGARRERRKSEREADRLAQKIRREANDLPTRADRARDRVPDDPGPDSLSDEARAILFGNRGRGD